jgi:Major Facilitator Superfamily
MARLSIALTVCRYGSAYMLTACGFILFFGKMYTFLPTKWIFLSGIVFFEAGSALCGGAPNSTSLIVGRAIAGFGSAAIFTGAIMILLRSVPLHRRPVFQGLFGACFGVASVAGPLIGGAFTQGKAGWRWCFYINLPLGGFTILALIFFLHLEENKPKLTWREALWKLDPIGTAIFLPAIISLLLALQWGGSTYAWSEWRVVLCLVFFAVLFSAWLLSQYLARHDNATIPFRILRTRAVSFGSWFQFMLGSTMLCTIVYIPLWFQAIKGVTPVKSGIDTIPMVLGLVVMSILSGGLTNRLGYYTQFIWLSAIIMPIGAGLLSTLKVDSGHAMWIGYQVLLGMGIGLGMQMSNIAVQTCLDDRDVPVGTAIIFFHQTLGGAIFMSVGQNVFLDKFVKHLAAIPGINPAIIGATGATALRTAVPADLLPAVLEAYNFAVAQGPFLVSTITACLAILGAAGMEWRSVHEKKHMQMSKMGTGTKTSKKPSPIESRTSHDGTAAAPVEVSVPFDKDIERGTSEKSA